MAATSAFMCIAGIGAFGAGFMSSFTVAAHAHRRRLLGDAVMGRAGGLGALEAVLRQGVPPLFPLAEGLMRKSWVKQQLTSLSLLLGSRGVAAGEVALCSLVLAAMAGMAVVLSLVSGSVLTGVLCVLATGALGVMRLRSWSDARNEDMRGAVPDALQSMAACSQTGLSLLQTLQQVASESASDLGKLFENAAHVLQAGGAASDALKCLQGNARVPELAFAAVALDVQHQTGGSMRQVLDAAKDMVEGELELQRMLKVQTAQARLSARVVTVMPFVMLALLSLFSDDFLSAFFESPLGIAVLAIALSMQACGVILVRRLLRVGE